ncbi:MAG: lipid A deacylase LpxR family protein [Pseudomonadota bacterium]|jgi:hypothetical protein
MRLLFPGRTAVIVLLALAALVICPDQVKADDSFSQNLSQASNYWSVQFENDFFTRTGDRHYTHGTEVSWFKGGPGPKWLNGLSGLLPFYKKTEGKTAVNYSLGQKIFTPEDLSQTQLIEEDRPYAGYLYFSTALLSNIDQTENLETGNVVEVTVGIVGPASGAEKIQTWYHELIDSDEPMGWDNQLNNEPGLGISYSRVWNIVQPATPRLQYGISPHLTAELGNIYTYGAGGVMFRLGNNLRASFSPPNIKPGFPGVSYFKSVPGFNWYLFMGHESRVVLRDIFLDGNTFTDSHRVDKERLVGEQQFGLALHTGKIRFAISNMLRTREFSGQDRLTQYGALNLSFTF